MTDEKKLDPFKPQQPKIPGVPQAKATAPEPAPPPSPRAPRPSQAGGQGSMLWVVVGVACAFIIGGGFWFWSTSSSTKAKTMGAVPVVDLRMPTAGKSSNDGNLPMGPGVIATVNELSKPWSSRRFLFRPPASADPVPAMVVHLPNGDYWGFSLREPFGTCDLDYLTNLDKLESDYGYQAKHPMVVDPCSHTVYDLMQYGAGAPDGGYVRGEIVHGAGVRAPMAIEIEVKGGEVRAVRME